jgi:integrase
MPLYVRAIKGREGLWISGTVSGVRVRQRAESNNPKLAREEAAIIEADILRSAWHGKRPGIHTLGQAVLSYLSAEPRAESEKARINRLLRAAGDVPLHSLDQEAADRLRDTMLRPNPAPGTVMREVITPLKAILLHAHRRKWCDAPQFETIRQTEGRTVCLMPHQVEALIAAAAPHLRPLLTFLVGTGARLGETLTLDWADVDLAGARARFWADQTKAGKSYVKPMPPATVAALAGLAHREGRVFLSTLGGPYADRQGTGGQIKFAWTSACRRAALTDITPHALRHTWASWHYALHRDVLRLKTDGGWSSIALVERYAHMMPEGHEAAIRRVWGLPAREAPAQALGLL